MRAVVYPSDIGGRNGLPASYSPPLSKSHFQRLCAAALLRRGTTEIVNPGRSEDDAAALRIIEELGALVVREGHLVRITSDGTVKPRTGLIHPGESGLAARLFAPIAALAAERVEIRGKGTLLSRPMNAVVDALRMLGVAVETNDGCLPLTVHGPVQPMSLVVDGNSSSQIVSGLLFALAASATTPLTLRAPGLVSRPYLVMSCDVLETLGWNVRFDGIETCFIGQANRFSSENAIRNIDTEADWSSVAAIAVGAALRGSGIQIEDLPSETQADAAILDILQYASAQVDVMQHQVCSLVSPGTLRDFHADCTHSPDLVPILAVLASACRGHSRITGLHRLVHKESDRAKTTSILLKQLSISHSVEGDVLLVSGPQTPRGGVSVDGHNDHRIVMAAAIAALRADGPVTIDGAEAVRKSYPDFFEDLQKLGVRVDIIL